ncbi:DUF6524 family protein [Desulfonatronum parangueonense]
MKFGVYSVLLRWMLIAGIILGTYNPSGRSYYHWATTADVEISLKISVGLILFALNMIFVRLTFRSMGLSGALVLTLVVTSVAVTLPRMGWVTLVNLDMFILYVILFFSFALTLGVSWSALRTRLSGQVDSDDISKRL